MSEVLTTDTYKTIYKDIIPSDEFRQKMLNQEMETKVYKMKPRLSYVTAIVACVVLMVSGTVYAYTHPAVMRAFFGEGAQQNLVEAVYSEIDKTIRCEGYRYIFEGNYYDEAAQTGYLAIRVEAEDGSIPKVEWYELETKYKFEEESLGNKYWNPFGFTYEFGRVGESEICLLYQTQLVGSGRLCDTSKEEEYLYLTYQPLNASDDVAISIIPLEEFKEVYPAMLREVFQNMRSIEGTEQDIGAALWARDEEVAVNVMMALQETFNSITLPRRSGNYVEYDCDGIHVEIGYSYIKATWKAEDMDVQSVATLIEGERKVWGNCGDAVSGAHISFCTDEYGQKNGMEEFVCWQQRLIDPATVQLEMNGAILEKE